MTDEQPQPAAPPSVPDADAAADAEVLTSLRIMHEALGARRLQFGDTISFAGEDDVRSIWECTDAALRRIAALEAEVARLREAASGVPEMLRDAAREHDRFWDFSQESYYEKADAIRAALTSPADAPPSRRRPAAGRALVGGYSIV